MQFTTLLVICVVFLLLLACGFGALWYFSFSDNAKLKRQIQEQEARASRIELEKRKAAGDEALALARSGQAQAIAAVRQATNVVGDLHGATLKSFERLSLLRTNGAGREIALYPELVAQARRLYETDAAEMPATLAVIERLESLRRIEQQLLDAGGTTYTPDPALLTSVTGSESWGRSALEKVRSVESGLAGLERESKIKVFTGTRPIEPPTLATAIQRLNETETANRQKTIIDKTDGAKTAATDLVAEAEAARIIARAKDKAAEILRDAEEKQASLKREMQIKEAEEKAKDTDTGLKKQDILDKASHQRLLAKASDPQIHLKMAALTTPGYYQDRKNGVEKIPVSLTVLQAAGALAPDEKGMNTLARIVSSREDKVRPRLKFAPNFQWKKFPEQIEQIKELQGLLIELAPVLVEKGMLAP